MTTRKLIEEIRKDKTLYGRSLDKIGDNALMKVLKDKFNFKGCVLNLKVVKEELAKEIKIPPPKKQKKKKGENRYEDLFKKAIKIILDLGGEVGKVAEKLDLEIAEIINIVEGGF